MADDPKPPSASNIKSIFKKVPTPVWLAVGGVMIGLAYAAWRDRNTPDMEVVDDENMLAEDYGEYGVEYGASYPQGTVQFQPNYPDSGETVGAIGQTALETLMASQQSAWESFMEFMYAQAQNQPEPELPSEGAPPPATPAPPPTSPQNPPPAAKPKGPTKPPHYKAGNTVRNRAGTVSKSFPGASGWIEIPTQDRTAADFHVAFPGGKLERWRLFGKGKHVPANKRGKANKIWTGRWK